jgi:hypothetical protein
MFRDVLTQLMSEACLFFSAEFFTRKQYLSRNRRCWQSRSTRSRISAISGAGNLLVEQAIDLVAVERIERAQPEPRIRSA